MIGFIDQKMAEVGKLIGMPTDPLKLFLTFILSYPFCAVLKRLPDHTLVYKQVFCLVISLFYLLGIFDLWRGLIDLLVAAAVTYGLAKYFKSAVMPWLTFFFLMSHLMYNHVDRFFHPHEGVVDITGAQMVLVMKLTAFAWNIHDGHKKDSDLSPIQIDRALKTLPPVLDYLTYVFFFPSLLVGPSFDFAEFQRWLDFTMFQAEATVPPSSGKPRRVHKRKIPRSGRVAARKAIEGVIWIALMVVLNSKGITDQYLLTDSYRQRSFLYKALFLWPLGFSLRLKYYGAWCLSEGACILSGLSYNGVDPVTHKRKWDRVRNINIWAFESAQNFHVLLESWNMNTNKWLKYYVYLRVTPKGKKPGFRSTMATFATSAFWHGVSPGYYLTFITGAFLQSTGRGCRRYIRPFFMSPDLSQPGPYKKYYDALTYVVSQLVLAYVAMPFVLLKLSDSISLWKSIYFYAHVGTFVLLVTLSSKRVKKILKSKLDARAQSVSKLDKLRYEIEQERTKQGLEKIIAAEEGADMPSLGVPDEEIEDLIEDMGADGRELLEGVNTLKRRATLVLEERRKAGLRTKKT
ncbi:MBOAT, membrane-bound O-acyltransferase family-domain-containing protein [Lipomyces oligophaga]|uniref:MBOAT, membrane-bound O-acyltransferase family-domain-containing protein n=1 Tax=Lipomyces oligophaga TaxID=45792 RepID=UPI0034CF42FE